MHGKNQRVNTYLCHMLDVLRDEEPPSRIKVVFRSVFSWYCHKASIEHRDSRRKLKPREAFLEPLEKKNLF